MNGRTLAGFSKEAEEKMGKCANCPYVDYKKFYDYYGVYDYAHQWVLAAFSKGKTSFTNGNADFGVYGFDGRTEVIKKGTAYMNVWMYVIREFEDALDDCKIGCIDCNDDPVHAWDEVRLRCFVSGISLVHQTNSHLLSLRLNRELPFIPDPNKKQARRRMDTSSMLLPTSVAKTSRLVAKTAIRLKDWPKSTANCSTCLTLDSEILPLESATTQRFKRNALHN